MPLPTGLPHLEGARGRIAGAVFILLTALAALLALGGTVDIAIDQFRNIPIDTAYGFRTVTDELGGNTVRYVAESARRGGLKVDDRIVTINGHPVSDTTSENEIGADMQRAVGSVTLMVRTGAGPARRIELRHIPGSIWTNINLRDSMPVWLSASLTFLDYACASWVLLAAALLLFLRRGRDPGAMAFAFAFALMAITTATTNWLTAYGVAATLAFHLPLAVTVSGFALFAVAVAGFPDGRFRTPPTRLVPFLVLPALVLAWTHVAFHADKIASPDWFSRALPFVAPLVPLSILIGCVAQVVRYRRDALTIGERQQFKWVIFAFAVTAATLIVGQTIFQFGGADSHVAGLRGAYLVGGIILAIAPPLGLLVSLLRYRLYDADAAISRSVAYGALTLALLAIFAGSEKVIEALGEEYFGHTLGALAGGIGAAIAAVMIAPLHHRVSHWAEHRFQKALLRLRHGLPLLVGDLRETASAEEIAAAVLRRCETGVRATGGAVVVGGELLRVDGVAAGAAADWLVTWRSPARDTLDCDRADPLFPMRVPLLADGVGAVGWLLLGPRPDGSFYGKDEREALAEIADPVARALAIARARAEAAAARRAEAHALSTRVARLEAMMARLTAGPTPGLVAG